MKVPTINNHSIFMKTAKEKERLKMLKKKIKEELQSKGENPEKWEVMTKFH